MCLVLYLASDKRRPLIEWNKSSPRFHVRDNAPYMAKVSIQLRKQNLYYVGSDNGCGCGFRREHDYTIKNVEELASKNENQKLLFEYVTKCLDDEDSIELYSCWSGDESLPAEHVRSINVNELLDDNFWFAERQHTTVFFDRNK